MSRPKYNHADVVAKLAAYYAPLVKAWNKVDNDLSDGEVISDLKRVFEWSIIADGYEVCKSLDVDHGWMPDSQLVEIFSDLHAKTIEFINDATKIWVRSQEFKYPEIGAMCTCPRHWKFSKMGIGKVVGINTELARCRIEFGEMVVIADLEDIVYE